MFLKVLIFKILYFLKLCPIFVGSVHNFDNSDCAMTRLSEKCLFPLDALMVSCPTWSKNLGRTLLLSNFTFAKTWWFFICFLVNLFFQWIEINRNFISRSQIALTCSSDGKNPSDKSFIKALVAFSLYCLRSVIYSLNFFPVLSNFLSPEKQTHKKTAQFCKKSI